MALHAQIQQKLNSLNTTSSVSGAVATITGNLSHRQLDDLMDAAFTTQHIVTVTAGVITVGPR
jgi:hypothetical protein